MGDDRRFQRHHGPAGGECFLDLGTDGKIAFCAHGMILVTGYGAGRVGLALTLYIQPAARRQVQPKIARRNVL
jgi:hypothetical protein